MTAPTKVRTFRFTVPGLPPRELSPNASRALHWGTKTRHKNQMRRDWGYAIKAALGDLLTAGRDAYALPLFTGPVCCQMTCYRTGRQQVWDGDGLLSAMKWGIDMLQELGVVANDSQILYESIRQEPSPTGASYIEVELTEAL